MNTSTTPADSVPDGHMLLLLAVSVGERIDVAPGGTLSLTVRGEAAEVGHEVPVMLEALDNLEGRGWVRIEESGAVVTEQGAYWLARWVAKKFPAKKGRRLVVTGVTAGRVPGRVAS